MTKETFYRRLIAASTHIDKDRLEFVTKELIRLNGEVTQSFIACEECGELIQAISKAERNIDHTKDIEGQEILKLHVVEEIADVIILIECLCHRFSLNKEDVLRAINVKIDHGEEVIEKYKEEEMKQNAD